MHRRGIFSFPFLFALVTLALNDHVLKHVWPSALTGKLSDIAGLFLFPVLVGALAGKRSTTFARIAALGGGAFFALCKLSPALAHWMTHHIAVTTCDPTDLVALPMLALGARHAAPIAAETLAAWRDRIALALAAFASIATSAQPPPRNPHGPDPVIAAPPRCAELTVSGIEPHGSEVIVHAHLVHDKAFTVACDVTLVATVESTTSGGQVHAETRAKSSLITVEPGRAVDVTVTLTTAYPIACNEPRGTVDAFEQPVGYPADKRPAASARIVGCATPLAVP